MVLFVLVDPVVLDFLVALEDLVDPWDLSLLALLGFLADLVNPSLRLLPFLPSLLSLQLSLLPQYLLLLLSPRLLLLGQVVHQMDLLLPPDLMAPLGRSVRLVLQMGLLSLLDRLLLLGL